MERNLPRGFYSKSGGISGIQGRLPRRWCRLGNGPSLYGIQTDLCFLTRQETDKILGKIKQILEGKHCSVPLRKLSAFMGSIDLCDNVPWV